MPKLIGTNQAPKDLVAKVTGRSKYAEDFRADGMIFAKLLLSPVPRGRVRRLDTARALAIPGVLAVATAEDFPAVQGNQEPVLTMEPRYQGQPIAAVAAVDEFTAAEAVAALNVQIQRLPFVLDPLDSLKPGALPKDVTREELATAKKDLETMKATWAEATAAASSGNTVEATNKGRTVQAKVNELKSSLGMNEQLAGAPAAG